MSALPDPDRPGQARADEPALVARALAGDRAALGTLVEAYAGSVRRITRAILGDVDDAEDAAQDGLLAALVKLDRYDPARPFGPWLLRIAANAAIDRRRRRTVRQARVLGDDVAAGVLTFVAGYLAGREREVATSFDTVWVTSATGSEAAAELLATHRAPDPSALFAAM